jgi:hypothetical protein
VNPCKYVAFGYSTCETFLDLGAKCSQLFVVFVFFQREYAQGRCHDFDGIRNRPASISLCTIRAISSVRVTVSVGMGTPERTLSKA